MSNLEDRKQSVDEAQAIDARYRKARAQIEKARLVESGQGAALFYVAMAYKDELSERSIYQSAVHASKLFLIACVCIIPNLLMLRVAF
jgi:hypothetical protein